MPTVIRNNDAVIVKETAQHAYVQTSVQKVTAKQGWSGAADYSGPYEVTPSEEAQTIETASKKLAQNIVIAPIPSNYGLITYNGLSITVS